MSQRLKRVDAVGVLHFPSTLDAFQMVRMKPRLTRILNQHPRVLVLDLGSTRHVKLAALGILVDRLRQLRNGTREIRFSNVSPRVHQTLVRAGMDGLAAC